MKSVIKKLALLTLTATIAPQAFGFSLRDANVCEAIALGASTLATVGGVALYTTCSDIEKNMPQDTGCADGSCPINPHKLSPCTLNRLKLLSGTVTILGITGLIALIYNLKVDADHEFFKKFGSQFLTRNSKV